MINTKMIIIGVLFFLVANPRTYKLANNLLSQVGLKGMIFSGGSVSQTGVVIHAAVFTMLFCFLFSCFNVIEESFIEGVDEEDKDPMEGMEGMEGVESAQPGDIGVAEYMEMLGMGDMEDMEDMVDMGDMP